MMAATGPNMTALFMDFARYFELSLATTAEQKAAVYRVRYSVYCEEFGYEDPAAYNDHLERDGFEDQSIHCLITHIPTGLPAGCVRLVTTEGDSLLPTEEHCGDTLDQEFLAGLSNRRNSMSEISRLAVDGQFRRRRGEQESRFGSTQIKTITSGEQRTYPLIAVSLFLAAGAVADLRQRTDVLAIMEPFLPVILRRSGIRVQRIGPDFEFRGTRAPYYLDIQRAKEEIPPEMRQCFDVIREQFAEILNPGAGANEPVAGSAICLADVFAPLWTPRRAFS